MARCSANSVPWTCSPWCCPKPTAVRAELVSYGLVVPAVERIDSGVPFDDERLSRTDICCLGYVCPSLG
jgi:hypothetical protein